MTFWDFANSIFWWAVLIGILVTNKSTFVIGLILAFILSINDGVCPFGVAIFLEILACIFYIISLKDIWKPYYEKEIRRLKRRIWKLENH